MSLIKSFPQAIVKNKKLLRLFLLIVGIVVVALFANGIIRSFSGKKVTPTSAGSVTLEGPKAVYTINREFKFPLLDDKGKELTKISYKIEDAELRKQIIVQGQTATAVEGKIFLILSIKIANDYNKPIDINARDYVRLIVNGNSSEQQAADIHNDPVTVQPISTKSTRIGFPVNETDKNMMLMVGEINGKKDKVEIKI